jgi:GNAT superfamily N-acetyltransferase
MTSSGAAPRIRLADPDDAPTIAAQRARMFADTGRLEPNDAAPFQAQLEPLLRQMLASGEYVGWLLVASDGAVIGGAGIQLRRLLPRPETRTDREALVVNVWIAPDQRRQGHARRLIVALLDWTVTQRIERVVLHPSTMGRPLYESLGFSPTGEMVRYPR